MLKNENICRLCLGDKPILDIFDNEMIFCTKIQNCCPVQVREDDDLPCRICKICAETLDVVDEFRKQCKDSDKILREKLSILNAGIIKSETKDEFSYSDNDSGAIDDVFETNLDGQDDINIKEELNDFFAESELDSSHLVKDSEELKSVCETTSNNEIVSTKLLKKKILNNKNKCINNDNENPATKFFGKQCQSCGKVFLSANALNKHIVRHDSSKPYKCRVCSRGFSDIMLLDDHLKCHAKKHACNVCGKAFKRRSDLRRHCKTVHNKMDVFKLFKSGPSKDPDKIDGEYSNVEVKEEYDQNASNSDNEQNSILKSILSEDKEQPRIRRNRKSVTNGTLCPLCGKFYLKTSTLYLHMKTHMNKGFTDIYKCDVCSKSFSRRYRLNKHKESHNETRSFPCDLCGKMFKNAYDALRHSRITHKRAKAVECAVCGFVCATSSSLKQHLLTHTKEKLFECDYCQQQFSYKVSLVCHIRTHTKERPFQCKYCESRFAISRSLKDHERLHTGERPYECPICSKGFTQLSNMKSHFRNNHKGEQFNYKTRDTRRINYY